MLLSVKIHVFSVSCSLNSDFLLKSSDSNIEVLSWTITNKLIPCAHLFHTF